MFSGACFGYAPWVKSIGPYRLLAELGRGGAGVVYRALDERDGRQVALKTLTELDALGVERFRREATLLRDLEHPNLVRVLDVHLEPPVPYLACELVEGETLAERVARDGPLPWEEAVRLVREVAAGLAEAHARGLLHRDVKPANVLLAPEGPKLADFGAVKDFGQESLTQTGAVIGTPSYMAPEQATGDKHRLSPRTDVYGLSATLFFALTGKPPFKGESLMATLTAVLGNPPPRPSRWISDLPPALDALCVRGLAKDPPRRPASPLALRAALDDLSHGAPPAIARYAIAAAVLACLAVGALVGVRWDRDSTAPATDEPRSVAEQIEALVEQAEQLQRREEDFEGARRLYTQAVELDPSFGEGFARRAYTWIGQGNRDDTLAEVLVHVETDCDRALAADPDCALGLAVRAYCWSRLGKASLAATAFEEAVALDPQHPEVYSKRGIAAFYAGRKQEALRDLDRAIALEPDDANLVLNRALIALDAGGTPQAALEGISRAIALEPTYSQAYEKRAEVLQTAGRTAEALEDYGRAIEANPRNLSAREKRAELNREQGDHAASLPDYDVCVANRPDDPWLHRRRAEAFYKLGRYEEALQDFERAATLEPGVAVLHVERGNVLQLLERPEEALAAYRDALAADPMNLLHTERLALLYRSLGRKAEALEVVDEAVLRSPQEGAGYLLRARLRVLLERYHEALDDYERALLLLSPAAQVHFELGKLHTQLRDPASALQQLDRALALDSAHQQAYALRGEHYAAQGRVDEARADLQRALELAPDTAEAERLLGRLQQLAPR